MPQNDYKYRIVPIKIKEKDRKKRKNNFQASKKKIASHNAENIY